MSTENEWAASMIGRTLDGQYRLDGILGEGAMGVVFRGTNLAVDKAVAIKMMRKETFAEPDAVERFKREAKVWSQLNHPSIAQVFDFGLQGDMPYLVMELVDGDDLSDVLDREGPLSPEQVTEKPKIDGRTDLYAAGVLFYELLTGQPPFVGTPHDVLFAHLGRQPEPLPESIPSCVQDVVMKLLRKKPDERYQSAVELEHALELCEDNLRGPSISSASNPVLTSSTIAKAIETRRGHRSGRRKPGESSGPRYGLWGLLGVLALCSGGLVALSSSLSLQRKLSTVVPLYKVPQDETVAKELIRLQAEVQLWQHDAAGAGHPGTSTANQSSAGAASAAAV